MYVNKPYNCFFAFFVVFVGRAADKSVCRASYGTAVYVTSFKSVNFFTGSVCSSFEMPTCTWTTDIYDQIT